MSRGPGRIQRATIEAVAERPGASAGRIGWIVADRTGGLEQAGIAQSSYGSYRRALKALTTGTTSALLAEKRVYAGFAEAAREYPFRTTSSTVRGDRAFLMPLLLKYVERNGSMFSELDTERYLIKQMSVPILSTTKRLYNWRGANKRWRAQDDEISKLLSEGGHADTAACLVDCLIKGREYFARRSSYRLDRPIQDVVADLRATLVSDSPAHALCGRLEQLVHDVLPDMELRRGRLRGEVYLVTYLSTRGSRNLQSKAWEFLRENYTTELELHFEDETHPPPQIWQEPLSRRRGDAAISRSILTEEVFLKSRRVVGV